MQFALLLLYSAATPRWEREGQRQWEVQLWALSNCSVSQLAINPLSKFHVLLPTTSMVSVSAFIKYLILAPLDIDCMKLADQGTSTALGPNRHVQCIKHRAFTTFKALNKRSGFFPLYSTSQADDTKPTSLHLPIQRLLEAGWQPYPSGEDEQPV